MDFFGGALAPYSKNMNVARMIFMHQQIEEAHVDLVPEVPQNSKDL
jgi:hypothetical protein